MALFVSAYSRVRVASERGKRDNPAKRPATNARPEIARSMERAKLNYDPQFAKRSLLAAFAQPRTCDTVSRKQMGPNNSLLFVSTKSF